MDPNQQQAYYADPSQQQQMYATPMDASQQQVYAVQPQAQQVPQTVYVQQPQTAPVQQTTTTVVHAVRCHGPCHCSLIGFLHSWSWTHYEQIAWWNHFIGSLFVELFIIIHLSYWLDRFRHCTNWYSYFCHV